MKPIPVPSGTYYKCFQHNGKAEIYGGNIEVYTEWGNVCMLQVGMGVRSEVSIIPKNVPRLIRALERVWADYVGKK